jgi:VWFA-related protein
LLKFVLSKPLGTRFAVFVLSDGLYLAQGFTEDRNVLARALDPTETHAHLPRIFLNADNYRAYYSLPRVLINIAKFLSDLPGHKNVIWLSESFPSAILPTSEPGKDAVSFNDEVREATDALAREQVAVYPIDVRGAIVTSPSASASARGAPGSGNAAINASYMTEEEIASTTGGHAFFSTNDLASALAEATENGGRYYTLTYSPSNQDYNGRVRHIRVEVSKRGYSLAYRHAYFGSPNFVEPGSSDKKNASEEMAALERRVDSLNPHMKSGAPIVHQVLFRVHLRPVGRPGKATPAQMAKLEREQPSHADSKKNQVKVRRPIDIQTYQIDYTIAAREKTLEVAATAFDENGRSLNGVVQQVDQDDSASIKEDSHEGIYRIEQQIDVPTTANSIRVGVKDVKTNNVGAMEVSLPLAPEGPTADASIHHSSTARQAEDR